MLDLSAEAFAIALPLERCAPGAMLKAINIIRNDQPNEWRLFFVIISYTIPSQRRFDLYQNLGLTKRES